MSDENIRNEETHTDMSAEGAPSAEREDKPSRSSASTARTAGGKGRASGRKGKGKKKKEKKKYDSFTGYLWGEWIRPLGTIFIIMGLFRLAVLDWFDVPSGSMEPTIMTGDRIFVNKSAFGLRVPFTKDTWIAQWGTPNRGDMVVCYSPDEGDEVRLVKRIVAVPGDTIEMREGFIFINGEAPDTAPIAPDKFPAMDQVDASKMNFFIETIDGRSHPVMFNQGRGGIRNFPPIEVPEDQYVIIGDNRDNSKDARGWNEAKALPGQTIAFMDIDRIQGRAFRVAFSLDGWSPRWGRFFHPLDSERPDENVD